MIKSLTATARAGDKEIVINADADSKFEENDLIVIQSTNFTYTTTEKFKVITKSEDHTTLTLDKLVQHPHV